ncbi:MAG TPA: phosphoenolpyruvate--protein phosphotransferase [Pyrinomonadaceae bacterium]
MDVIDSKFARGPGRNGGEIHLKARPMSRGVAIGRIVCLHGSSRQFFRISIEEPAIEREARRARAAFRLARRQLNKLRIEAGPRAASVPGIFDAQRAMIDDSSLLEQVEAAIAKEKVNAEWAVKIVTDSYIAKYKAIADEHLRERYIDVEDVADRILSALGGGVRSLPLAKDSIIVAEELMPSTLAEQRSNNPTAVITEHGGWTSHTFILARELNIPAVAGVRKVLRRVDTGDAAIVDGYNGTVILNPSEETVERYRLPSNEFPQLTHEDSASTESHASTLDAREVILRVNVDLPDVYAKARRIGARGVGLYRSEFLFNRYRAFPTENQQCEAYREIAELAGDDGVKIRTFDVGPEQVYGQAQGREKNPALGLRAIRLGLVNNSYLRTQLRALLRAAFRTHIDIVIPMVSSVDEIIEVRSLMQREKVALEAKGVAVGSPRLGAMVEVPSAVFMIEEIVSEADLVCLGTNDLVQYILAADRDNESVAGWFRTLHPAVLRAIKAVIQATEKAEKPLVICGEMAGSPFYIPLLIGMGATELSMNLNSIPRVRKVISGIAYSETLKLARDTENCRTADETEAVLERYIAEYWSHLLPPSPGKRSRI